MSSSDQLIPSNYWHSSTDKVPPSGQVVLGTDGICHALVVWHASMGRGGDFATVSRRGRNITLTHRPGFLYWCTLPAIPGAAQITADIKSQSLKGHA